METANSEENSIEGSEEARVHERKRSSTSKKAPELGGMLPKGSGAVVAGGSSSSTAVPQRSACKIYHDFNGWKNDIETIKNKYPKSITGGTSIGVVPDWVQTEVDNLNS